MEEQKHIYNTEQRILNYNTLLKEVSMNKEVFDPEDKFVIWYKAYLRWQKNLEARNLRRMVLERQYEKQGLGPAYMYAENEEICTIEKEFWDSYPE